MVAFIPAGGTMKVRTNVKAGCKYCMQGGPKLD
jgi:hypothetical protein